MVSEHDAGFCRAGSEREHLNPASVISDSELNALTLNDVQSNNDRMLVKEVVVDLEALTGKRFDLDACCDDLGVNSHCADYCSPAKSFLSRDVCGGVGGRGQCESSWPFTLGCGNLV